MRGLLTFVLAALLAAGCTGGQAGSADIVLDFNVSDKTAGEVVLVVHNDINTIALDQEGKAEFVLTGCDAAYARLFYGRDFKWVYLE